MKTEGVVLGLAAVGVGGLLLYVLTRPAKAKETPPPKNGETSQEVVKEEILDIARQDSQSAQDKAEEVRTLPPVSLSPEKQAELDSARLTYENLNSQAAAYISQCNAQADLVNQIGNQADAAAAAGNYTLQSTLLAQYSTERATHLQMLATLEGMRTQVFQAQEVYSKIRAGLT